ncbi:MAG TPA: molybdenum cofactor guanylyltransferase [Bacteroidales bacterium]|nr:molybdenum cofactor guanylyltransferase [Bacteroidales bacterium]
MISGILLAGGKSRRMGRNKAFMRYKGEELYQYPLAVLRDFSNDIIVSAPSGMFPHPFPFTVVPDEIPQKGPLGGIYTCLKKVNYEKAVILSCDIPFISSAFIRTLLDVQGEADVVAGTDANGKVQPLAAIYSSRLWPLMKKQIEENNLKMHDLLMLAGAKLIDAGHLGFNPDHLFFNVNDRADFDKLDNS